jgi:sulfite exporter TauE/SafE
MSVDTTALALTAASIALLHTVLGPDHYLPFLAMAAAGRWSTRRTLAVTTLCGLGHVLSSVALGTLGLALGASARRLLGIEAWRGHLAAWVLLGFGLAYAGWGLRRAWRSRVHVHVGGDGHGHLHDHRGGHAHVHAPPGSTSLTPWALFVVFLLGPCEPLIPLLLYPAAHGAWGTAVVVTVVFGAVTIAAMAGVVWLGRRGLGLLPRGNFERYSHVAAGAAISMCAAAILMLHI